MAGCLLILPTTSQHRSNQVAYPKQPSVVMLLLLLLLLWGRRWRGRGRPLPWAYWWWYCCSGVGRVPCWRQDSVTGCCPGNCTCANTVHARRCGWGYGSVQLPRALYACQKSDESCTFSLPFLMDLTQQVQRPTPTLAAGTHSLSPGPDAAAAAAATLLGGGLAPGPPG
jgi:hypothetical protein